MFGEQSDLMVGKSLRRMGKVEEEKLTMQDQGVSFKQGSYFLKDYPAIHLFLLYRSSD